MKGYIMKIKVKDLKKYLELYEDEKEVVIIGSSGITYDIIEEKIAYQTLTDTQREVCKLHMK